MCWSPSRICGYHAHKQLLVVIVILIQLDHIQRAYDEGQGQGGYGTGKGSVSMRIVNRPPAEAGGCMRGRGHSNRESRHLGIWKSGHLEQRIAGRAGEQATLSLRLRHAACKVDISSLSPGRTPGVLDLVVLDAVHLTISNG